MTTSVIFSVMKREPHVDNWLSTIAIVYGGAPYLLESFREHHRFQLAIPMEDSQAISELAEWFHTTYATHSSQDCQIDTYDNGIVMGFNHRSLVALALLRLEEPAVKSRPVRPWRA